MIPSLTVAFTAKLWRYPGKGGWHFVTLPDKYSPPVTHAWGRTPVVATVDGHVWKTSVWRGKAGRSVLAIPKAVRGANKGGASMKVRLTFASL